MIFPALSGSRVAKTPLAKTEIANLKAALDQYHVEFGEYAQGENASILKALFAENPKKIKFFAAKAERFNALGQFLDPWKTPHEMQILAKTNLSIRSFGPNRIRGDKDDLSFPNP